MNTQQLLDQRKQIKEQIKSHHLPHCENTAIRFHRSCSWLKRAAMMNTADNSDMQLINQWIAFNALYGRWDPQAKKPCDDYQSWQSFTREILKLDKEQLLAGILVGNKKLVYDILDDLYVGKDFWENPDKKPYQGKTKTRRKAETWYFDRNWTLILEHTLKRVYLNRCQLMHGAATFASSQNRKSLRHSTQFMGHFMPTALTIFTTHGAKEDWGELCYPPQK